MTDQVKTPPPFLLPPHVPTGLDALGTVTNEDLARDLAASQPKATPSTGQAPATAAPGPDAGKWAALRDRFDNPFDPVVHLTKTNGEPAVSPTGKLYARPGMTETCKARAKARTGDTDKPRKGKAAPAKSTFRHDADEDDDSDDDTDDLDHDDQVEPDADPAPTPADIERDAEMDAQTLADGEELLLDFLISGEVTTEERARLERSAKRVIIQDQVRLPVGAKTLHSIELLRVFNRRAKTPEGKVQLVELKKNLKDLVQDFINLFR